jgi:hypothetical protein
MTSPFGSSSEFLLIGASGDPHVDPMNQGMNGVAREFWSEIYDVRAELVDPRDRRAATKERRKKVRAVLTRRPTRGTA